MDRIYARDFFKQHLVDAEPLTGEDVQEVVDSGLAYEGQRLKPSDFEERLPGQFWHKSHEPFPEGWTQANQDAANG